MREVWKNVEGHENYYQISNIGKVRSKDMETRNNRCTFIKKGRTLKPQPNSKGYLRVNLSTPGKRQHVFVHRLVAIAFVANPENKPCVNHIDSCPLNNSSANLEWVTHIENMRHAVNNGRFAEHHKRLAEILRETNRRQQKPVKGVNVKTGEVISFESIQSAGRHFNGRAGEICMCCKGQRETAQGYRWEYA